MGRSPCCDKAGVKKGPWTPEEDEMLVDYIKNHGCGSWRQLPKLAGLNRCGKSCRLRWSNYLRPDIKRGRFSEEEEQLVIHLHSILGNKWSVMASQLPGRTDNEIKNHWNTHLRKKLLRTGIDPVTHRPRTDLNLLAGLSKLLGAGNTSNMTSSLDDTTLQLQANAAYLARLQLVQNLLQIVNVSSIDMDVTSFLAPNFHKNQQQATGIEIASIGLQDTPRDHQGCMELSLSDEDLSGDHSSGCKSTPYIDPIANSSPSLVSTSLVNMASNHTQNNFTSPIQGQAWNDLNLDDLDISWKDILDKISWSKE